MGEVVLFTWRILAFLVECGVSTADWHNIVTDIRQGAWITELWP